MKKEIKTYEELLKCDGMKFEATYQGKKTQGLIYVDSNEDVFCLQNDFDGSKPVDDWEKHGYRFSWVQFKHKRYNFNDVISTFENIIVEEEWTPKFGELVYVSDINDSFDRNRKNIFLFEKDGLFHVLDRSKNSVKSFNSSDVEDSGYTVYKYKYVKQIEEPKPIEITLDEAKKIIAESKNVSVEQINLNFKID